MLHMLLVVGLICCAIQTIRSARLLAAALWLAGLSAFLAIFLYAIGAPEIGAIELSVGVGLVTVLLVFAISIAGAEATGGRAILPRPLAWGLAGFASSILGWMTLPWRSARLAIPEDSFAGVLWRQRGLDVLVQIVLIFAGALGVLALLADDRAPAEAPGAEGRQECAGAPVLDAHAEPAAEIEEVRV